MGLFEAVGGAIIGRVLTKYEADVSQHKAAIKDLSGEQKKLAQENIAGLQEQTKTLKGMKEEFVKGAAIVAGALLVARNGLGAMKRESQLTLGAAGVDIDKLSEAAGGLKTRWELLTLAQSGASGAWRLTSQQIAFVITGMRALEAKGFDATEVFTQFTEVMKNGKLEGLDKFGLATKSTGTAAGDLMLLMKQLSGAVNDVGGNFDKAGDSAQRSIVKMEDGLTRLRVVVGQAAASFLDLGEAIGTGLGRIVGGPLDQAEAGGDPNRYARGFQVRRGGLFNTGTGGEYLGSLVGGPSDRDRDSSAQLNQFRARLRGGHDSRFALEAAALGLPEGWRDIDPQLATRLDARLAQLRKELQIGSGRFGFKVVAGDGLDDSAIKGSYSVTRFTPDDPDGMKAKAAIAKAAFSNLVDGMRVSLGDYAVDVRQSEAKGGRGGRAAAGNFYGNLLERGELFARRVAGAAQRDAAASITTTTTRNAGKSADDLAILDHIDEVEKSLRAELPGGDTWLERVFGKVDEVDAYTEAFTFLGSTVQSVAGQMFKIYADGGELTMKAVRKMVAAEIGAEGSKLQAKAISAILTGGYNTLTGDPRGPGQVAAGLAMEAGAIAIGGIARAMGGSGGASAGGGGSSGSRGQSQDHRGGGARGDVQRAGSSTLIVLSSTMDDESPIYRGRRIRDAARRADGYPRPSGTGQS